MDNYTKEKKLHIARIICVKNIYDVYTENIHAAYHDLLSQPLIPTIRVSNSLLHYHWATGLNDSFLFVGSLSPSPPTFTQWNNVWVIFSSEKFDSYLNGPCGEGGPGRKRERKKKGLQSRDTRSHASLFYWVSLRFIRRYFYCPKWYPKPPLAPTPLSLFRHLGETLLTAIGRWRGKIRQWENECWSRPPLPERLFTRFHSPSRHWYLAASFHGRANARRKVRENFIK